MFTQAEFERKSYNGFIDYYFTKLDLCGRLRGSGKIPFNKSSLIIVFNYVIIWKYPPIKNCSESGSELNQQHYKYKLNWNYIMLCV